MLLCYIQSHCPLAILWRKLWRCWYRGTSTDSPSSMLRGDPMNLPTVNLTLQWGNSATATRNHNLPTSRLEVSGPWCNPTSMRFGSALKTIIVVIIPQTRSVPTVVKTFLEGSVQIFFRHLNANETNCIIISSNTVCMILMAVFLLGTWWNKNQEWWSCSRPICALESQCESSDSGTLGSLEC